MASKVFCLLILAKLIIANPQQLNLDDRIERVFGTIGSRGFGDIVEPENIPATQSPQFLHQNGQACRCIPYHQCEPDNTRGTTDSRFFGEIDIRFIFFVVSHNLNKFAINLILVEGSMKKLVAMSWMFVVVKEKFLEFQLHHRPIQHLHHPHRQDVEFEM